MGSVTCVWCDGRLIVGEVRRWPDTTRDDLSTGWGGFDSVSTGEGSSARAESIVLIG